MNVVAVVWDGWQPVLPPSVHVVPWTDNGKVFVALADHKAQVVHFCIRNVTPEAEQLMKRVRRWKQVGIVITTEGKFPDHLADRNLTTCTTEEDCLDAYEYAGLGQLRPLLELTEIKPSFYDQRYFYGGGHSYLGDDGSLHYTGYLGRQWDGGYAMIWDALEDALGLKKPYRVMDLGCDCGGMVDYLVRRGVNAYGVDYSSWAIEHPIGEAKDRIKVLDMTDDRIGFPPGDFDVVFGSDIWEHIYHDDLRTALRFVQLFGNDRCRYVFQVPSCLAPNPCRSYILNPGQPPLAEASMVVNYAKGHVTMQEPGWWAEQFLRAGFWLCPSVKEEFIAQCKIFQACPNWLPENVYILTHPKAQVTP